jgi:hypothetical protein
LASGSSSGRTRGGSSTEKSIGIIPPVPSHMHRLPMYRAYAQRLAVPGLVSQLTHDPDPLNIGPRDHCTLGRTERVTTARPCDSDNPRLGPLLPRPSGTRTAQGFLSSNQ